MKSFSPVKAQSEGDNQDLLLSAATDSRCGVSRSPHRAFIKGINKYMTVDWFLCGLAIFSGHMLVYAIIIVFNMIVTVAFVLESTGMIKYVKW